MTDVLAQIEEHEATLLKWRQEDHRLSEELAALVEQEQEARFLYQRDNPSKRSDGVGGRSGVTEIRKKINVWVGKREKLLADISAKELILSELRVAGEEIERERLLVEQTEQRLDVEGHAVTTWDRFQYHVRRAAAVWDEELADSFEAVDRLEGAAPPIRPVPRDMLAALRVALMGEDGSDGFSGYRTVLARRLDTVTGRADSNDHTGYAHTLSDLSAVYPGSNSAD